jgi:hypothetical protein
MQLWWFAPAAAQAAAGVGNLLLLGVTSTAAVQQVFGKSVIACW